MFLQSRIQHKAATAVAGCSSVSLVFFFVLFFLPPSARFCIVPAVLANQHSCSRAGMRSRWYAFPLRSGSSGDEGFPLHLHHHPNM